MKPTRYQVLAGRQKIELEIKKSKFIGHALQTDNRTDAMNFIAQIRSENPQANHNCWAFQAGPPGDSREIGCSDDGEPHGTAGKPMLNVLMHAEIGEITVVVTRYFGGIKLGTGGLARAYADTVKTVLESATTKQKLNFRSFELTLEYCFWPQVESLLRQSEAEDIAPNFNEEIHVHFKMDQALLSNFKISFQNITHGKGNFIYKDHSS